MIEGELCRRIRSQKFPTPSDGAGTQFECVSQERMQPRPSKFRSAFRCHVEMLGRICGKRLRSCCSLPELLYRFAVRSVPPSVSHVRQRLPKLTESWMTRPGSKPH